MYLSWMFAIENMITIIFYNRQRLLEFMPMYAAVKIPISQKNLCALLPGENILRIPSDRKNYLIFK